MSLILERFYKRYEYFIVFIHPTVLKIWEARKKVLIINILFSGILLGVLIFIVKPYYTSTITILPDYGSKTGFSNFNAIASIISGGDESNTEIYQTLLYSESVLTPIILSKWYTTEYPDSISLIDYFQLSQDSNVRNEVTDRGTILVALNKMKKKVIETNIDPSTRALSISVTLPESKLSAEIANALVHSLENYIIKQNQSNAKSQRIYIEGRLKVVADSLSKAEEMLRIFQTTNRAIVQSPELFLEQSRLQRKIDVQQNLYLQLTQQLESAKLDEIRDTPVLNVEEFVKDPVVKSGPPRLLIFIAALTACFFISLAYFPFKIMSKKLFQITRQQFTHFN